jgi:hypothetical protein
VRRLAQTGFGGSREDGTRQFWTAAVVPGRRFGRTTGGTRERRGIQPDVEVPAHEAMAEALALLRA